MHKAVGFALWVISFTRWRYAGQERAAGRIAESFADRVI
jgi:hypothetical protein